MPLLKISLASSLARGTPFLNRQHNVLLLHRQACTLRQHPLRVQAAAAAPPSSQAERRPRKQPRRAPAGGAEGERQERRETKEEAAARLSSRIVKASGVGQVAGPLRVAIRQGVAGPRLLTLALDRLQELHRRRKDKLRKEASPYIMQACKAAVDQAVAQLDRADLRLLAAVARTPYWLQYAVPQEQQQQVTDRFVALVESELAAQQAQESGSGKKGAGLAREVSNFVWAALSNPGWHMSPQQRGAVMACVRRAVPGGGGAQQQSKVLVGLMRLQQYQGAAAVAPYIQDGTAGLLLDSFLGQLGSAKPQECQDALLSVGRLALPVDLHCLDAILQRLLGSVGSDPRPLAAVSSTLVSLARLHSSAAAEYAPLLELPSVMGLCEVFVGLAAARCGSEAGAKELQDDWGHLLVACAQMRYNPELQGGTAVAGTAGGTGSTAPRRLFDALLEQLPAVAPSLQFFRGLDVLLGLSSFYGFARGAPAAAAAAAAGGQEPAGASGVAAAAAAAEERGGGQQQAAVAELPPSLVPYRALLAALAGRLLRKWPRFIQQYEAAGAWPAGEAREVVAAFAALGRA